MTNGLPLRGVDLWTQSADRDRIGILPGAAYILAMPSEWWDTTASFSSGVPFAVDGNDMWRGVDSVERGKACGCFCAECHGPLIARKGDVRVHHFAHEDRKECRLALEASLFGMTIAILNEPGAKLQLPDVYSPHFIAMRIGEDESEVAEALHHLSFKPASTMLTLTDPVVACSHVRESEVGVPEITETKSDFALHLLSSGKRFHMLEQVAGESHGRILALNPLVFARGWQAVCDPEKEDVARAASSATGEFREWLANTAEGRGWLFTREGKWNVQQVKDRITSRRIADEASKRPLREYAARSWQPPRVVRENSPPPPEPDEPDEVLQPDAGVCVICRAPMDVIRSGSGVYPEKRLMVCRVNRNHPLKYLGA